MPAISSNLPIYEDKETAWDSGAAIARIKDWASNSDGDIDFSKYRKGFFWVDPDNEDIQGGYKLPFADLTDGKLEAVYKGVSSAMGALNGSRGGINIPDGDKEAVYAQIKKYYKKFGEDAPELKDLGGQAMTTRKVGERVDVICAIEPSTVKELGEGVFEALITTSALDRHGESIATSGIDTSKYMSNPVVLYGHDYESLPIGKTTKLSEYKNKIKAQFQLAIKENPFAATVADMIKGGYLNATSIGGIVKQWSADYSTIEEMEMVEFSVVPVPANAEALITSRTLLKKVTGKSLEEISGEYRDFVAKTIVDKAKALPDNELQQTIKHIESLLVHLKQAHSELLADETDEDENTPKVKYLTLKKVAQDINAASNKTIRLIKLKEQ